MNTKPYLIKAINPVDLREQALDALQAGHDLHGAAFVSHEGLICQLAYTVKSYWDFALVVAGDLDDYEREVQAFTVQGFDLYHGPTLWNNQWYLQWMYRIGNGKMVAAVPAATMVAHETLTDLVLPVDLS